MERLDLKTLEDGKRVEVNALHQSVRRHALGWLVVANTVGLWLAALLLWPDLNDLAAPFTYGRWVPLHLDWQLYGWCALPLVGAVFRFYFDESPVAIRAGQLGLWAWTLALAYAGVTWLAGDAGGKLFVNFAGAARIAWSLALLLLWVLIAWRWFKAGQRFRTRSPQLFGHALLAILLAVPFVLYWAADPSVHPAVNPDSGGPTGTSLLGSTLALIALFGVLPHLLRQEKIGTDRYFWPAFILSVALFAGMEHSHVSHHEFGQIAGLAVLLAWIPAAVVYARTYRWKEVSRRWLIAAFAWWLGLVVTGFLFFLPGWSEQLKFTNALVAHTHLAMAGLVTSLHMAILLNLDSATACSPARERRDEKLPPRTGPATPEWRPTTWSFWLWQAGCTVHIIALFWLGWHEGADSTLLTARGGLADRCYELRLAAGAVMWIASISWLCAAWKQEQRITADFADRHG